MNLPDYIDMSIVRNNYLGDFFTFGSCRTMNQEECVDNCTRHAPGGLVVAYDLKPREQYKAYGFGGIVGFWNIYKTLLLRESKNLVTIASGGVVPVNCTHLVHHYEVIKTGEWLDGDVSRPFPCHIVMDIDMKIDDYQYGMQYRKLTRDLNFQDMIDIIIEKSAWLLESLYNLENIRERWDVTQIDASCVLVKRKFSRHIIIALPDDLMFASWADVAAFVRRVILLLIKDYGVPHENPFFISNEKQEPYECIVDYKTFTNFRCMRFVGSSKKGEHRPLQELRAGKVWPIDTITEEFFRKTLVQYIRNPSGLVRPLCCSDWDGTISMYSSNHAALKYGELIFPIEDISELGCGPENLKKRKKYELQRIIAVKKTQTSKRTVVSERTEEWQTLIVDLLALLRTAFTEHYMIEISSAKWNGERREMRFELNSRQCPYQANVEHTSNHIRYHMSLMNLKEPKGWFKCYGCADLPGYAFGDITFMNAAIRSKLLEIQALDDALSMKKVRDLFPLYAVSQHILY